MDFLLLSSLKAHPLSQPFLVEQHGRAYKSLERIDSQKEDRYLILYHSLNLCHCLLLLNILELFS